MQVSKELINNCLKKDNASINELYRLCYSLMKGISLRYQKSEIDAEIAFNQGFLKVLDKLKLYDQSKSFKNWFTRVIVNTNIDLYRSRKRHNELTVYKEEFNEEASYIDIHEEEDKAINYAVLIQLIDTLTPMSKKIFNMYVIDGFSHAEIAEVLNLSEGTSKWHLHNARKKLQVKVNEFIQSQKMVI